MLFFIELLFFLGFVYLAKNYKYFSPPTSPEIKQEVLQSLINNLRLDKGLLKYNKLDDLCEINSSALSTYYDKNGTDNYLSRLSIQYNFSILTWRLINSINEYRIIDAWVEKSSQNSIYGDYQYSCVKCNDQHCMLVLANRDDSVIEENKNVKVGQTIDCIGPDNKHLQVTQKECDAFNASWKNNTSSKQNTSSPKITIPKYTSKVVTLPCFLSIGTYDLTSADCAKLKLIEQETKNVSNNYSTPYPTIDFSNIYTEPAVDYQKLLSTCINQAYSTYNSISNQSSANGIGDSSSLNNALIVRDNEIERCHQLYD